MTVERVSIKGTKYQLRQARCHVPSGMAASKNAQRSPQIVNREELRLPVVALSVSSGKACPRELPCAHARTKNRIDYVSGFSMGTLNSVAPRHRRKAAATYENA